MQHRQESILQEDELVDYGIDDDGPVPLPMEELEAVIVPQTRNPLTNDQYHLLLQQIKPTASSADGWGIDLFLQAIDFVTLHVH